MNITILGFVLTSVEPEIHGYGEYVIKLIGSDNGSQNGICTDTLSGL